MLYALAHATINCIWLRQKLKSFLHYCNRLLPSFLDFYTKKKKKKKKKKKS